MKHNFRTQLCLLLALLSIGSILKSQVYSATWVKGNAFRDDPGIYGNPGIGAPGNTPGARNGAVSWQDASGNFWLFGGNGYDCAGNYDFLSDLWKYSPGTNQWTFVKGDSTSGNGGIYGTLGTAAATNKPGGRIAGSSWVDASGNFWLFGGVGYDGSSGIGELNDLWKYNIATNQWTWMGGSTVNSAGGTYGTQGTAAPTNVPGARIAANTWTDLTGTLWLFGGVGYSGANYGDLQDLWKYSTSTNQWTWVKGTANTDVSGTYGTQGTAAAGNLPGSRYVSATWIDASGNLWLMGGLGYDAASGFEDALNDLWKYNIASNQWTWVKGSNLSAQSGTYGTQNVPATINSPGARAGSAFWTDVSGNLYLFGGNGYDASSGMQDNLNDLWKYNIATNQWTWLKGANSNLDDGQYGIKGVPSVNNNPSARSLPAHWIDANSNLWFFGGNGIDSIANFGDMNDLWKLETCVAPTIGISASSASVCPGNTLGLVASGASTYSWSTNQTAASIVVTPVNTSSYIVTGTTSTGCSNSKTYLPAFLTASSLTLSASSSTGCTGSIITVTANGATTYSWSTGATNSTVNLVATSPGVYTITCWPITSPNCVTQGSTTLQFFQTPTVGATSSKTTICKGQSAVLTATGAATYSWNTSPVVNTATALVSPVNTTTYVVTGISADGCFQYYTLVQQVLDCAGVPENANNFQLSVFPNPSNGNFKITTNDLPGKATFSVFNAIGQQMLHQAIENGENTIHLPVQSGVYFYRLTMANQELKTGKLIIE